VVTIDGIETHTLVKNQLARFRNRHIGFVFQFHQLLPEFSAVENVCIPGFIARRPRKEVENRAKDLLDFLGLSERLDHKPAELSGGEQITEAHEGKITAKSTPGKGAEFIIQIPRQNGDTTG